MVCGCERRRRRNIPARPVDLANRLGLKLGILNESATLPPQSVLHWLAAHAGFPARRLPAKAETLILFAAAAAHEERTVEGSNFGRFPVPGQTAGESASLKARAERRKLVHFKCDNSAKV